MSFWASPILNLTHQCHMGHMIWRFKRHLPFWTKIKRLVELEKKIAHNTSHDADFHFSPKWKNVVQNAISGQRVKNLKSGHQTLVTTIDDNDWWHVPVQLEKMSQCTLFRNQVFSYRIQPQNICHPLAGLRKMTVDYYYGRVQILLHKVKFFGLWSEKFM